MTLRYFPKIFCYIAILFFSFGLFSLAKAEVYGYILTINVQAENTALQNGQSISKELAASGKIKIFLKVIDPSDPQKTFAVDKWDVVLNGIGASQWELQSIATNLNNYSADLILKQQQIQTGASIHAIAYVGTHQTNEVSFMLNVTKAPFVSVTPTPVISPVSSPILPTLTGENQKTKIIPPVSMLVAAVVSIAISSSMSVAATSLVVNGAASFIPSIFIFLWPGLASRKRPKWGKVLAGANREALKFIPIDLIRVEQGESEQVVARCYTDEYGDYGFSVKAGQYKIRPAILEAKIDTPSGDFYKEGDIIEVSQDFESPTVNPLLLRSLKKADLARAIYFSFFKSLQVTFLILAMVFTTVGTLLSLYVLFIQPSLLILLLLVFYLILWAIMISSWVHRKYTGRVIDKHTRLPIAFAVVRIMNESGTHFVRGAITNEKGDFSAVLKKGRYMILSGKEGYRIIRPKIFSTRMHSIGLIEMLPQ